LNRWKWRPIIDQKEYRKRIINRKDGDENQWEESLNIEKGKKNLKRDPVWQLLFADVDETVVNQIMMLSFFSNYDAEVHLEGGE